MESLTISLPKTHAKTLSIGISKENLTIIAETMTALLFCTGIFIWLFI